MSHAQPADPGDVINGRYRIEKSLMRKAGQLFYSARDLELKDKVLVVFLDPSITDDLTRLSMIKERFLQIRKTPHPLLLKLFNMDRWQNYYFITGQFSEGTPLSSFVSRLPELDWKTYLKIADQLYELLDLHNRFPLPSPDFRDDRITVDSRYQLRIMPSLTRNTGEIEQGNDVPAEPEQFITGILRKLLDKVTGINHPLAAARRKRIRRFLDTFGKIRRDSPGDIWKRYRRRVPFLPRSVPQLAGIGGTILILGFLLVLLVQPRFFTLDRQKILLLDFSVLSTQEDLRVWEQRFPSLVGQILTEKHGYIPVFPKTGDAISGSVNPRLPDRRLKRYLRKISARWIITGRIHQAGNLIQIDLMVVDMLQNGRRFFSARERVFSVEDLPAAIRRLCRDFVPKVR